MIILYTDYSAFHSTYLPSVRYFTTLPSEKIKQLFLNLPDVQLTRGCRRNYLLQQIALKLSSAKFHSTGFSLFTALTKPRQQLANCLFRFPPVFQKTTPPSFRLAKDSSKHSTDWRTHKKHGAVNQSKAKTRDCRKTGSKCSCPKTDSPTSCFFRESHDVSLSRGGKAHSSASCYK